MDGKKRGQFYLIGAFVIIVIIISYAIISNYSRAREETRTYDLAEELRIESANVLDYGTYNEELEIEQMTSLLEGFIEAYSEIGEIEELYFIFGNAQNITFVAYQQLNESLSVEVGIDGITNILTVSESEVTAEEYYKTSKDIKKVTVIISGIEYVFHLKEGENFYFILSQVVEGEKHVVVS